ncbi:von Willebrand factor type A [Ancylobacter novellus DSM 506]|uniref:von Willebrand factor type A n=1 Tax=Ancylobacter novellus (strain ATCC 8093 / DSM 506 / JCM 20403 / CCM 1077 / IAM 12100 / NBRC 12443 / NCIMB 10456) TaxID=639283 RepID=D7A7Z8_ANCN5|nr:VWA domain-containing protein [Ancylobacter novellus]ADH90456.1 von Willebrand factor type A [Ancylobacter novellus DSM 506]
MSPVLDIAAPHADRLARLLAGREGLAGIFADTRRRLSARLDEAALEDWAAGGLALLEVNAGASCLLAYWRASLELAPRRGDELGEMAMRAAALCREAGGKAAAATLDAFVRIEPRLAGTQESDIWWRALLTLARAAPDCVERVAERAEKLMLPGHVAAFADFIDAGLKAAGRDRATRRAFFALEDRLAQAMGARIGAGPGFAELEAELKTVLTALWGTVPNLQPLAIVGRETGPRANIAGPVIRLPEAVPGMAGEPSRRLYLASAVHASSHLAFGNPRFPVRKFKPVQIALATLVEDARIEALAMRRYPGLRRLWAPYHDATPEDGPTVAALLKRVARGLFDPTYADPDALVGKAQALFASAGDLDDPALSLGIGTRLANDIGQRRLRFDARGHVAQPAYRDDGLGLWDFSDIDPEVTDAVELMVEAARIERREAEDGKEDEPSREPAGRARPKLAGGEGTVVATYPEWDAAAGIERPDWTTVREMVPAVGDARVLTRALDRAAPVRARIARLVKAAKVGRTARLKRQAEGHDLDIDAAIEAAIARRAGEVPDLRVFRSTALLQRDLAVLVLVDVSQSTRERLADGSSVLDIEKLAVAMLAEALEKLGDDFALLAFASNGRGDVRATSVKGFSETYDAEAAARLAGLSSGLSTRLGTALRHAGAQIARVRSFRKLILVLTDGEPSDIDAASGDLVADARRVVLQLRGQGIDTFGVTLDPAGVGSGPAIFGKANAIPVRRVEDLPMRLSELYFRLARR